MKKRTILLLTLGFGGFSSLLVGLAWEKVLRTFATDLARIENFFNLINPEYVSLAHTLVAGIVGLGHFLVILGASVMLVGFAGAAYTYLGSRNSRWRAPDFRRTFLVGTGALMLLAIGSTAWATSAVSYQDKLAAKPGGPSSSAGQKEEHHDDCEESPTLEQHEAADKLAAETKAGVAKYVDLSAAEADGYQPSSPSWRPITHYLNPAYQRDGELLDSNRPEALVYANTSEGTILLGAMYVMSEPGESGPQIGGCLTQWHAHSLQGWETPEMMHVWSIELPSGPFSELRPRQFVESLES
jgi:hypothetical protein